MVSLNRFKIDTGRHYFDRPIGLLLVIAYKAIWGFAEVIIGTLVIFSYNFFAREIIEDPQDILARYVLFNLNLTQAKSLYVGLVVIGLGLIKLLLAICLWSRLLFIRKFGIAFFSSVGAFGFVHLVFNFSWLTFFGLVIDLLTLGYFIFLLPRHLNPKKKEFE